MAPPLFYSSQHSPPLCSSAAPGRRVQRTSGRIQPGQHHRTAPVTEK